MYPMRLFSLLLVAISFVVVARATYLSPNRLPGSRVELMRRQDGEDGNSSSADTPLPSGTPSNDDDEEEEPTSSVDTEPSQTPEPSEEPESSEEPTPEPTSSPEPSRTPEPTSSPTSKTSSTTSEKSSSTSTPVVVDTSTTTIVTTDESGRTTSMTSTSRTTTTPGLSESNSKSTGMTEETRNTVIGVVVGVGGAIVLSALALVAWRIWGRRRPAEEADGLMTYDPATAGVEKSDAGSHTGTSSGRTPFQTTLENYHRPTQVNPSANF